MSRLSVVTVVALVASAAPVAALDGIVTDERTGRPIANAEVTIPGRPGTVHTDAHGRFTWQPSPAVPFEVLVILPDGRHARPVLVTSLPQDGPLVIRVSSLVEESVTVVAGVAPDIDSTPGAATTVVTARDLEARAPAVLVQSLENVAGASPVSEGHSAVPALRGLARGRTLILVDGTRVTAERRVGPSAMFLDPTMLEAVEVARGPGAVAYGSDAFGGVILARTRRVVLDTPFSIQGSVTAGTGVPERRVSTVLSQGLTRGGWLLAAHYRDFDDYRSPRGEIFNSSARDRGVLGRVAWRLGPGLFNASWQSDLGGEIDRPRDNSRVVRFYYPTEDSHRLTLDYEARQVAGFSRVSVVGLVGSYRIVTDQDRFPTATRGRSLERADVDANDFQVRGVADRILGRSRLQVGVDVNGRFNLRALDIIEQYDLAGNLTSRVQSVSIDDARRTNTGAFGSLETAPTPRVVLSGGLRGDFVRTRNRGGYFGDRHTSHGTFSGFGAATVGPFGGVTVTGQVARGFRDPVLSDRYYRGPTGRGFITGNPDLDPETSLQFDGAIRYTSGRLRLGVHAFHYRIDDLVERYQTQADFFFFRNRGRARIRGVEVEAQSGLWKGASLLVAGHVQRGTLLDDGSPLDDISADTLVLQVRQQVRARGWAQMTGRFFAADDRPGPTERARPAYAVADLSGGVRLSRFTELRAVVRNLFDTAYLVSPDARAVYAPGISASVTLAVGF